MKPTMKINLSPTLKTHQLSLGLEGEGGESVLSEEGDSSGEGVISEEDVFSEEGDSSGEGVMSEEDVLSE